MQKRYLKKLGKVRSSLKAETGVLTALILVTLLSLFFSFKNVEKPRYTVLTVYSDRGEKEIPLNWRKGDYLSFRVRITNKEGKRERYRVEVEIFNFSMRKNVLKYYVTLEDNWIFERTIIIPLNESFGYAIVYVKLYIDDSEKVYRKVFFWIFVGD